MLFQEPSVEFVRIEMDDIVSDVGSCNSETSQKKPSGEICNGCDAPQNNCTGFFEEGGSESGMPDE